MAVWSCVYVARTKAERATVYQNRKNVSPPSLQIRACRIRLAELQLDLKERKLYPSCLPDCVLPFGPRSGACGRLAQTNLSLISREDILD